MEILLAPPLAFGVYLLVAGGLSLLGRAMSGSSRPSPLKTSLYAGGNSPPERAVPGYRAFFVIALFFATLHLGALVIGISDLSPVVLIYMVGLAVTLLVLLLG